MRKTNGNDEEDICDELNVILKRIDYLEQQSDERNKMTMMEHGPCKMEI